MKIILIKLENIELNQILIQNSNSNWLTTELA